MYDTPRAWANKGESLFNAFEALAAASQPHLFHLNLRDQALMLAGMSMEILVKSILVNTPRIKDIISGTKPSRTESAKCLNIWKTFYGHNLIELADQAEIQLNENEKLTAIVLSEYVYWRGRYVIPMGGGIEDLMSRKLPNGQVSQLHNVITYEATRNLLSRVIFEVKTRVYGETNPNPLFEPTR